ncbi:MAG: HAD family hydrolase [Candidatus Bathyarchaeota archaeon]|jgi:phosphoglycolate phosphatase|nr:HAD family hydrolase [Candidatus Bathyarchaeota archaeon A05DMB-5]MDH7557795.1 HAD family hydrolase [Candidatus Bathyarchaeota archaeon]
MEKLVAGDKIIECKLVIFDKNGTLVNQHLLLLELAKARKNAIEKHGGKTVSELWERIVGVDLKNEKIDHGGPLGTAPRREEILIAAEAFYLSGYSWSEAKQSAQRAYDEADGSIQSPYGSVLLEGVAEALKRLKQSGLKLAIASTDTHKRTVESFKTLEIAHFFDAVVGSDDVMNGKPSPDMVLEILKKTESKPSNTVIVGDSVSDMQMGRNAKLKACIGVLTGFTSQEKLEQVADVVVSSVSKLYVL